MSTSTSYSLFSLSLLSLFLFLFSLTFISYFVLTLLFSAAPFLLFPFSFSSVGCLACYPFSLSFISISLPLFSLSSFLPLFPFVLASPSFLLSAIVSSFYSYFRSSFFFLFSLYLFLLLHRHRSCACCCFSAVPPPASASVPPPCSGGGHGLPKKGEGDGKVCPNSTVPPALCHHYCAPTTTVPHHHCAPTTTVPPPPLCPNHHCAITTTVPPPSL